MTYKYARCSCGWHHDVADGEKAADLLAAHAEVCECETRSLLVPMWSVAWPYYWAVQNGDIPDDYFGLEMDWRPMGSHTAKPRQVSLGCDAKEWHLFPSTYRPVRA